MGEGKKDRSEKRAKSSYGIDKSSSDTELANQDKRRIRTSRGRREQWAFIDGLTVDNLARFRRRRVETHPKDTLGPVQDDMKDLITEYRYAFRSSDDIYRAAKENLWAIAKKEESKSEAPSPTKDKDEQREYLLPVSETKSDVAKSEPASPSPRRSISSFSVIEDDKYVEPEKDTATITAMQPNEVSSTMKTSEHDSNDYDEFFATTEYSNFVAYAGIHRAQLARRATSLKMEGDMETTTEKCDKFIPWLNVTRPELVRLPTHLKLEGEIETSTENHDQYVPFLGAHRSESYRHHDHLKLEGESRFIPEYTDVFKEFDIAMARQKCKIPKSHLKPGGFYDPTEIIDNFVSPRTRQAQLMEELARDVEAEEEKKKSETKNDIEKKREEDMKVLVAKLEDLKGPPLEIAEYTDAYKNFPRERPRIYKRDNEIGKADGTKVPPSPTHKKFPLKLDQDPEYKSIYLDLPQDRPMFRSPSNMRSSGPSSSRTSVALGSKSGSREYLGPSFDVRHHSRIPKIDPWRVPATVKLDSEFDIQPEFSVSQYQPRKSDYAQYKGERRLRRARDRSISASRKDNYWINQDNGEHFGRVNAAEDQDAFQVLQTRVHEESVVGKPPRASRRPSRALRPTHLEFADRSTLQNRSPSPSYRLHVCHVDDQPWGFSRTRNRSPSLHKSSEKLRDASQKPPLPELTIRSYSPSFANKERRSSVATANNSEQSFVVLDNAINSVSSNNNPPIEPRARRRNIEDLDQNSNSDYSSSNLLTDLPRERPRNRTPPNWMPPWYDSTDTI